MGVCAYGERRGLEEVTPKVTPSERRSVADPYRPLLHVSRACIALRSLLALEQKPRAVHSRQAGFVERWQ